jgi:putative ABC transport system permease protein
MTRLYRLLVRLYPREFRVRYGDELADVVEQEHRHAPGRSAASFRVHLFVMRDLLAAAARLRRRQLKGVVIRAFAGGVPRAPDQEKRSAMETAMQDVQYALRQFARRPGFTAVAVLSMALAIGGNTLIFGILDGFVFHPFPYPDPDRLVAVGVTFPKLSSDVTYVEALSPAEYQDIRANRSFSHVAAFDLGNRNIAGGDVPERVFTALLLDDLFPVIGLAPALGRGFTREELRPNGPSVAIISHRLWRTRFGGDPNILARAIRISGQTTTVVGVMPPGLTLIGTDLWLPWGGDPLTVPRNRRQFNVLARLTPGAGLLEANTGLAAIAARTEASERAHFAEYEGWRLTAAPLAAALLQDVRPAAFLVLVAAALVLIIACANLTNLFLARATTRQRELAVRLALGAARWRVARLLVTESLLVAAAGALLGGAIAWVGLRSAEALIPAQMRTLDLQAAMTPRVLWLSLALTVAAGLAVAIAPAVQAARTDPQDSLKSDGRSGAGRAGGRVREGLVVLEIALSVLLFLGAGLLIRSFANVQRVDLGFDSRDVLTMRLTLPRDKYPGEAVNAFFDNLIDRLGELPGVESVSAATQFPPLAPFETQFRPERGAHDSSTLPSALITLATPRHFETLRVPMYAGRSFAPADRLDSPRVAIVNRAFASRFFPGQDPVGQRLAIGSPDRERPWTAIVGVVADYRNAGATLPVRPEIFLPVHQQSEWNQLFFLIRAEGAAALLPAVRKTVTALDAEQPVYATQTLAEAVADSAFQQRISAVAMGIFAAVALTLAAIGIYGVMSFAVSARTQELGIRMAVGASRQNVIWLVMRQVLGLLVTGTALGLAGLAAVSRTFQGLLVDVAPLDPITIAIVVASLAVIALAAAWSPAARASRVEPMRVLKYE